MDDIKSTNFVVITANGLGTRFQKKGFSTPKYLLIAKGHTLFYWSVISLKKLFRSHTFLFLFNKNIYNEAKINEELKRLKLPNWKIILVENNTDGQASTLFLANEYIKSNDNVLIYNIDTHIKPTKICSNDFYGCDGLWYVFISEGTHWSFMKINKDNFATEVAEKNRISDLCSIGLYWFAKWSYFVDVYKKYKDEVIKNNKESYIAPFYQYLINDNKKIKAVIIPKNSVIPLGTPDELSMFDKKWMKNNN